MFGYVQKFIPLRGFGFLVAEDDCRERYFVHIRDWKGIAPPAVGMKVHFEPQQQPSEKLGLLPNALSVTPVAQLAQSRRVEP
jgi:cold shock CspA family protein